MDSLGVWMYVIIFFARIIQISINSVQVISMTKGEKLLGSIMAIVDITIWLLLVASVISNLQDDPLQFVIYVLGTGIGVYVGSTIESFIALGHSTIHIIVDNQDGFILAEILRGEGFGVTILSGQGQSDPKNVLLLHVKRKRLKEAYRIITEICPSAVFTVNESKTVMNGYGF